MTPDDLRRRERLKYVGYLLFGPRYQSPLAAALGVKQPTIAQIIGRKIALSDDLERRLGELCLKEVESLSRTSVDLARVAVEIAAEQGVPTGRPSPSKASDEANSS